jgi:hypothetical protein
MRLDRDALEMIATARIFISTDLIGDGPDPDAPEAPAHLASCGHPADVDGECSCSSWPERAPADTDIDGMLLITSIISASQVLIGALLDIIDTDDEARLAMAKHDVPGVDGKKTDIDPTLFAAWADTRDMAKHWAEQARARELEVRAEMGDAMTALVDGKPAIVRIKRTEAVRAHPRKVDYLKPVGAYLGVL